LRGGVPYIGTPQKEVVRDFISLPDAARRAKDRSAMANAVPTFRTAAKAPRADARNAAPGTVEKALDLLFFLHASGSARGVSEIGRALGVPKSSAHRLLASLGRRGLVEQDEHGRYRPGIALLALGLGALEREPLAAAAHSILERESEATGETAFLTVARGGRIVVLDKREGAAFLRVAPTIGSEVPVHATAVGKLHLAFAPDSVRLAPEPWPVFTGQTPISRADLEREVAKAKKRGWATNRDEWIPGMAVVAAPVLLRDRMLGCMVVAAPSSRVGTSELAALAQRVVKAASDIAARLEPDKTNERTARSTAAGSAAASTGDDKRGRTR
jgi:DNA-binding IclR family transcriptional regulator